MELFKQLSSLNCPVKINSSSQLVGESRILLFEWLLRVYDEEFAEQCARESSSRTTRLARQLFVLGLGGTKQAQCEAFVSAGSTANIEESMYVVSELVQMILMARELTTDEALRASVAKDMDFLKKLAPKCNAMFEPVSLFPASLLEKVDFEEQIDPEKLMGQLSQLLEKLKAKIATLEAQSKLEKSEASFLDPNTLPQLSSTLESFILSVSQFNAVYRSEMALWKVSNIRVNTELGNLAEKVHAEQSALAAYLESFDKAHSAVVEIGQIGREIVSTLALTSDKAAVLSDENVATTAKLANLLEKH